MQDARLTIVAHNQRALETARALVAEGTAFASAEPVFELRPGAQELDPPIQPPRSASLEVLDSLAARYASRPEFVFDTAGLPIGSIENDIEARGFQLRQPEHNACTNRIIRFTEIRQWENGMLNVTVHEGGQDRVYSVQCADQVCRMPFSPMTHTTDYVQCVPVR